MDDLMIETLRMMEYYSSSDDRGTEVRRESEERKEGI